MISCVCIDSLNPYNIYNAIRRLLMKNKLRTLPKSLTEYLCENMTCEIDEKLRMHDLNCITGKCANSCQITNVKTDLKSEIRKIKKKFTSYYIYSIKLTEFFSSSGEKSSYTRTARIDSEGTLKDLVDELEKRKQEYLQH